MKMYRAIPLLIFVLVAVSPVDQAEANAWSSLSRAVKRIFRMESDEAVQRTVRAADAIPSERALMEAMREYPPIVLGRGTATSPFVDLTEKAFRREMADTIGRDLELRDLMEALSLRSGGYGVIVGEAGVGKSQLIAGLTQEIIEESTSLHPSLLNTRVIQLDRAVLTSGASVAGNLDSHLAELKEILTAMPPSQQERIILAVEDIGEWSSLLQGPGSDVQMFLARLKEVMDSTRIKVLLTGTNDDLQKIITPSALSRRLSRIHVAEPTTDQAYDMITAHLPKLKETYGVNYSVETVTLAIRMADKFDTVLELPGSALRLLEQAAVYTNYNTATRPRVLLELQGRLNQATRQLELAQSRRGPMFEANRLRLGSEVSSLRGQIEHITALHTEVRQLSEALDPIARQIEDKSRALAQTTRASDQMVLHRELQELQEKESYFRARLRERSLNLSMGNEVDENALAQVVARDRNSSVERILEEMGGDGNFLSEVSDKIRQRIVGQRHVVETVLRHLHNTKEMVLRGVRGAFLGVGPSQTGKSEFGRALGDTFGQGKVLRINCGDYKDRTAINAMMGADPGYVGYVEGGILTNFLRRVPDGVVWFDEVEKAHPSLFDILLPMLDAADPHVLTKQGEKLSTRESIFWMTGNLLQGPQDPYTRRALERGLIQADEFSDAYLRTIQDPQQMTEHLQGILTKLVDETGTPVLRNELYNRLHGIFKFYEFNTVEMIDLVRLVSKPLVTNFESLSIGFSLADEVVEAIALRSGRVMGNSARVSPNLERFVTSRINSLRSPPAAGSIQALKEGDMVHVALREGATLENAADLSVEEFQNLFEFIIYGLDGQERVIRSYIFDVASGGEQAVLRGTLRSSDAGFAEYLEALDWNFEGSL